MSEDKEKISENNVDFLKSAHKVEPIAALLNVRLVELSPGYARVAMKLAPEYRNFNGMVFGGMIMAVADEAFAYATNSVSHPSIAVEFNIHFISGPALEDELIGECRVVRNGRRMAFAEMKVTNQDGKLIARASGITARVGQA